MGGWEVGETPYQAMQTAAGVSLDLFNMAPPPSPPPPPPPPPPSSSSFSSFRPSFLFSAFVLLLLSLFCFCFLLLLLLLPFRTAGGGDG